MCFSSLQRQVSELTENWTLPTKGNTDYSEITCLPRPPPPYCPCSYWHTGRKQSGECDVLRKLFYFSLAGMAVMSISWIMDALCAPWPTSPCPPASSSRSSMLITWVQPPRTKFKKHKTKNKSAPPGPYWPYSAPLSCLGKPNITWLAENEHPGQSCLP